MALPWVLGAQLGWLAGKYFASRYPDPHWGLPMILSGGLGWASFSFVAMILAVMDAISVSSGLEVVAVFATALVAAQLALALHYRKQISWRYLRSIARSLRSQISLTSIFALAVLLSWVTLQAMTPVQAWDALSYWARVAGEFILHIDQQLGEPFIHDYRHPLTLSLVLSWSGIASFFADMPVLSTLPWWLYGLSGIFILIGFSRFYTSDANLITVSAIVFMTMPLMENHILLAGYAELPATVGLMVCSALLAVALRMGDRRLVALALTLSFPIFFTKNIGPILSLLPLTQYALAILIARHSKWPIFLAASVLTLIVSIAVTGISVDIAHFSLAYDPSRPWLDIGGRRLEFNGLLWQRIAENSVHAYFVNSSFNCVVLIFVLALLSMRRYDVSGALVMLGPLLILLMLLAYQTTGYGMKFATPSLDTGFSRFSLYFVGPACLCIPLLFRHFFVPTAAGEAGEV